MKPALLTSAALLMAVSSGVFAQTTQAPSSQTPPSTRSSSPSPGTMASPPSTAKAGAMNNADNARAARQSDAGGMFANVPAQTGLSSKVVGLSVYNSENTDVATIKDIAFDANGVKAYILSVGGFLGMGDRYVAVQPSAIDIKYDATNGKIRASMNTNVDQLKSAPEFKYSAAG